MAKKENTAQIVTALLSPIINNSQVELVDVEFVKEGSTWYLRIYIDKEGGVTIDDCEAISRLAESCLEEKDPISQAYILEVSSPGLDRPLKKESDFQKYKDSLVEIKLYQPQEGKKDFTAKLLGLQDEKVFVSIEGQEMSFARKEIASIRLAVVF